MNALVPYDSTIVNTDRHFMDSRIDLALETLSLVETRVMILSVKPMTAFVAGTKQPI